MYKIGVIGDKDSIYGFAALGLSVYPCEDAPAAAATLKQLVKTGFGVVYITEALYGQITEEIDRYRDLAIPAIIPIPGVRGNTGIGLADVSRSVEKAVGSDILS